MDWMTMWSDWLDWLFCDINLTEESLLLLAQAMFLCRIPRESSAVLVCLVWLWLRRKSNASVLFCFVLFLLSGNKNIIVNNFKHVTLMQLCYMQKQNYVSFSDFSDFTVLWGNSVYYVQHVFMHMNFFGSLLVRKNSPESPNHSLLLQALLSL